MMNKLKIGQWIIWIGICYFLTYNTLFGWNMKPINELEETCDAIFKWTMRIGVVFIFLPVLDWYFLWAKEFYRKQRDGEGI